MKKKSWDIFQLFHSRSQLGLLSLAAARYGRTWLLLVFRSLDSYCVNNSQIVSIMVYILSSSAPGQLQVNSKSVKSQGLYQISKLVAIIAMILF